VKVGANLSRNNLDCLRLILASTVALFHVYALTELPAFTWFGRYLSPHFAVRSFFVISGLLIYQSYVRSSTLRSYAEKRIRRIYPAYFTVVIIAAFGLFLLSNLPASKYFGAGFVKYLGANLVFLNFLAPSLPGVFTSNTVSVVNGALWTLKIEVAFYIFVPVLHFLCDRFGTTRIITVLFVLSCLWKYGFAYLASAHSQDPQVLHGGRNIYSQLEVQFPAQLAYFAAGILLLLHFDKLKHHFGTIAAITVVAYILDHWLGGEFLDVFWITGVVFVFGFWRYFGSFAKHGDFSYGVYIVHWPVLQTMIALGALRLSPPLFLFVSLSLIGLAAFLMWNFIESRFLARSSHYRQVATAPG
jgi:peptidoglycan/LPS O-acetylase OafA/YrhL